MLQTVSALARCSRDPALCGPSAGAAIYGVITASSLERRLGAGRLSNRRPPLAPKVPVPDIYQSDSARRAGREERANRLIRLRLVQDWCSFDCTSRGRKSGQDQPQATTRRLILRPSRWNASHVRIVRMATNSPPRTRAHLPNTRANQAERGALTAVQATRASAPASAPAKTKAPTQPLGSRSSWGSSTIFNVSTPERASRDTIRTPTVAKKVICGPWPAVSQRARTRASATAASPCRYH